MKILRNAIKCVHCGLVLESNTRHDFVSHRCEIAGLVGREFNHALGIYESAYPMIAVDGGKDYLKRSGDPEHWVEMAVLEEEKQEQDARTQDSSGGGSGP